MSRLPSAWAANSSRRSCRRAQDRLDLATQEEQRDDRHNRDQGEDEGVLDETLAFLVLGHHLHRIRIIGHRLLLPGLVAADSGGGRRLHGKVGKKYYHTRGRIPILR